MNTIIALIMGLVITMGGVTETTTITNVGAGTKTVTTKTMFTEHVEYYTYDELNNEWDLGQRVGEGYFEER